MHAYLRVSVSHSCLRLSGLRAPCAGLYARAFLRVRMSNLCVRVRGSLRWAFIWYQDSDAEGQIAGVGGGGGGALVAEADSPDVEAAGRGGGRRGRGGNAFGNVDTNVDMMPGSSTDIMTAIADIPMPIETRDQVKAHLSAHGFAKTTVQWLLSNLRSVVTHPPTGAAPGSKKTRTLEWRFDIGIARALIENASRVDSLPLLTCRFRADGKVSVTVPTAVSPRSVFVSLSSVKAMEARFHACVGGCAERLSPCGCLGVTRRRDHTHLCDGLVHVNHVRVRRAAGARWDRAGLVWGSVGGCSARPIPGCLIWGHMCVC